jgi:hypothetical protein
MIARAAVSSMFAIGCLIGIWRATPAAAQPAASRTMAVVPGVFFTSNPCALNGQGETVQLTNGTVLFFDNAAGATEHVRYQDVVGVGETSGLTYSVGYQERRLSSAGLSAQLTMVSSASRLLEVTILDSNGNATIDPVCLSLSTF